MKILKIKYPTSLCRWTSSCANIISV